MLSDRICRGCTRFGAGKNTVLNYSIMLFLYGAAPNYPSAAAEI
ncbi:MAG: hypothetical protein PUK49_09295 [Oscillospiraceae bacterium]|nr:hypothetical protein [Oscillospiraceae bacterium]